MSKVRILFDGPPSHESGRFVEVEDETGKSINVGEWKQEGDYWILEIERSNSINDALAIALEAALEHENHEDGKCGCNWTGKAVDALAELDMPGDTAEKGVE